MARPSLKRQWLGWAPGVGSDGAAGKCQSIPVGIRKRRTIMMRWRWTTPKTRGAAPRTRTQRARRSPRMGIAQVCNPAGLGPSPRAGLATGRSPHAGQLRPAGRAGRGEREGAETGSRPSAAPRRSRGAVWLQAGPGWLGGAGRGPELAQPRALRRPTRGGTRPWDLRTVPWAIHGSRECPAACLGDSGNSSSLPKAQIFPLIFHLCNPSQHGWIVGSRLDLYWVLCGLEFNLSVHVNLPVSA